MTTTTSVDAGPAAHDRTVGAVIRVAAAVTGVAVVANLLVLLIGRIAGADMIVEQPSGTSQSIGVVAVVMATLIGLGAGTLLLLVVRNRGRRAWTAVALIGLVLGLLTVAAPLSMAADSATHVTLAAMHVVTGLAWFLLVRREASTSSRP